jgi:type IX secretion system PorP/SprF family membrane protein
LKRLLYIALIIIPGNLLHCQQLPIYSQYLFNKYLICPAVAGSDGYTSFNLTARQQWVGYSGAPRTFSVSGQTRLLKRSYILKQTRVKKSIYRPKSDGRVGIGGSVFSDKNGLVQRTGFQATYAYHMWLQNETQLSLGLAVTGYQFKIDEKALIFEDPDEPWLNSDLIHGIFVPDASFGIYLLNAKYNVGFSADQLFQAAAKIGSDAYDNFKMSRQYNIFASYNFSRGPYMELQPSFLFRISEQLKPQADIGLTYIHDQIFWGGLAYRTSGAIITNIGVKYEKMFFGYAFDFTLQEIQRVTYGTHEITIAVKFGDSARKFRWLDRY